MFLESAFFGFDNVLKKIRLNKIKHSVSVSLSISRHSRDEKNIKGLNMPPKANSSQKY